MPHPHKPGTIAAAGAVIACLIGAGFASGQEVLQFFTVYGRERGAMGGGLASVLLGVGTALLLTGRQNAFSCCGPLAGRLLAGASPLLLFGVYAVMLAGAGALVQTGFGLPALLGRAGMLVVTLVTVLAGLGRMTDILGRAGPLIVAFVLAVALGTLLTAPPAEPLAAAADPPARSWWMAALVYAGYNLFLLAPFLQAMGSRLPARSGIIAAWLGCGGFGAALVLLHLAFCRMPTALADTAPAVALVAERHLKRKNRRSVAAAEPDLLEPVAAAVPVLLAGVYTTAAPLLFSVCEALPGKEGRGRWKVLLVGLAGFAASGAPFGQLVAALYPLIGWFGLALTAGAVVARLVGPPVDKPCSACYDARQNFTPSESKKDGASL